MTGIAYSVDFETGEAAAALGRLSDMEVSMIIKAIGERVVPQTRNRFLDTKTGPDGKPWAPWSRAYARTRENKHSLLIDEKELSESIQPVMEGNVLRVGSQTPWASFHQLGTSRGIPARPFLGLSRDDRVEIEEVIFDYIESILA